MDPNETTAVELIEEQAEERIRRVYVSGQWYFSIVDIVGVLTDSPTPRRYWAELKRKLRDEGFAEVFAHSEQLKMRAADGKMRNTDAADLETILRIIQSIPSPKAEPIKQWLAKVGAQRVDALTQPLPPTQAAGDMAHIERPPESAPAIAWAEYYEALAALYRRQAAYESRLAVIDSTLAQHGDDIDELHSRVESLEAGMQMLPEILERLGPEMLTPEHQRTVQNAVKRLHEVGGYAYATIYAELGQYFHVAKYDQIPEARWEEVAEWFRVRLDAVERRTRR